ncbi:MAG: ABC transporter permease [Bacillota bacterium]|nr:ABC transporter permease [Bacillota bacterium]
MNKKDMIDMSLRSLWKRKVRTILTVLGVVIGTASIVVMVSIGIGMNQGFAEQLESWGSLQVIHVYPGGGMVYDEATGDMKQENKKTELNARAVEEMKEFAHVDAVSPVINEYLLLSVGKYVADASVVGLDPSAMEALGYKVEEGRLLTEGDSKSVVVGGAVEFYDPKLSWEMRYSTDPPQVDILNEKINLTYDWNVGTRHADKSIKPFRVDAVGRTSAEGADSWSVFMPIRELEKIQKERKEWEKEQYGGNSAARNQSKEYSEVLVKVDEMEQVQAVQQQIKDMGFRASSLTDELASMQETTKMLRLVLGAIGAISMLVAAISITNTMVMSIYERTKEIGIMKVIGASLRDIRGLFLMEAAFIGFAGGVIGIVLSYLLSFLVNMVAAGQGSTMQSAIPLWLALGAVVFATGVGVAAGYLPANRAMKLSALTAIKTE